MPQKGHLLLVDDEETFLHSTAELLRQAGYTCDEAVDAEEAIEKLQENDYDLVIADIKMPGNANLELVQQLADQSPSLPVILVTGYPSMETAVDAVNLDAYAYFVKPMDFDELMEHVDEAVERKQTLQLLRQVQRRARRRVQEFNKLRAAAEQATSTTESLIEPIFDVIFQDIADAYVDLRQLCTLVEAHRSDALLAALRNDPEKQQLTEALEHAIDVIEETKRAFKSRQLAELREDLEATLAKIPYRYR